MKLAAAENGRGSPRTHAARYATALVHEVYLRLVGDQQFDGQGPLPSPLAAEAMCGVSSSKTLDESNARNMVAIWSAGH